MMDNAANGRPLLEIMGIEVVYHRAVTAVQGVSINVQPGSITALIGTNGAGKTTTLTAVAGFMHADDVKITQGEITFDGTPLRGRRIDQISAMGVGYVPERDKIFATLTVEENLAACRGTGAKGRALSTDEIYALFPRLAERRKSVAGYLSGGERQMLAISLALITGPRLIMIDELTLGLAPLVTLILADVIAGLRKKYGISFLIVEQNALTAVDLADYIYVMENGRIVFDGPPDRLRAHEDFQEFYLGIGAGGEQKNYRDVKQYRRKRRWFG